MAHYGYAIWDSRGVDVTGLITPVFFLDKLTAPSGSKTYYNQPPGKSLKVGFVSIQPWNSGAIQPTISVSGNTVSWSNLSANPGAYIYTFWG